MDCGWRPDEISYTGTNVSERDLDVLLAHGIHLNLDAISQIERYGRRAPGGGDRDPDRPGRRCRLQRAPRVRRRPADEVRDRAGAARRRGRGGGPRTTCAIDTVHFHAGSGWLADGLAGFERALVRRRRGRRAAARPPGIRSPRSTSAAVSGAPAREDERAVDLDAYAAVLARHLGPLGVTIACEPGDLLSQGRGDPARRGRDRRAAAGRHVRRARHRLERQLLVLHLPVRPGVRRLPRGRGRRGPRSSRSPGTSTRPATSSPRTTRCRRSRRATSSRLLNAGGYLQAMSSTHCLRPMGDARSSSTARRGRASPQLGRALDVDPDERARLEPVVAYCGYLRAKGGDDRARGPAPSGSTSVGPALAAKPGEPRPVLVPAVDEDRDRGSAAMSRTRARASGSSVRFGLSSIGVYRIGRLGVEDEADRDGPRPAVRRDRDQDGPPRGREERPLRRGQDRVGRSAIVPIIARWSRGRLPVHSGDVEAALAGDRRGRARWGHRRRGGGPGRGSWRESPIRAPTASERGRRPRRRRTARRASPTASPTPAPTPTTRPTPAPLAGADGAAASDRRSPARLRRVPAARQRRSSDGRGA